MINILLVEKDKNYSINLLNSINLRNVDLKIVAILANIKDIASIITQNEIDIILIDINLYNYKEFSMFDYINKKIILLVEKNSIITETVNNLYILGTITKCNDFSKINYKIKKLINEKYQNETNSTKKSIKIENKVKRKIINELHYLGYDFLHKGSKYLIESIYIIYFFNMDYEFNLEKDVYPIVAKKYNQTWNNVKSAIRYATDIMYYNNEEEKLKEYLKKYKFSKFGVSIIILAILEKIRD